MNDILNYINGRSCAILGLGVSNLPLARMLASAGVALTVYDRYAPEQLGDDALALEHDGVRFVVADDSFYPIDERLIFRSPGIRPDVRGIREATEAGAELVSEIELFLKLTRATCYAVTGSDGKTTTTTLTGKFLENERKTYVGGNIGTPLLDKCEDMSAETSAVLELSSFQLMTLADTPERVAITNVSPNHLDWHTDMDEYIRAKKNIIGKRTKRLVTNADCTATADIAEGARRGGREVFLFSSTKHSYGEIFKSARASLDFAIYQRDGYVCVSDGRSEQRVLEIARIKLPGRHNLENYMTAIGLTFGEVSKEIYTCVAESFGGVEHRLEWVRELDGVDYYNSSIDSSPTRTAAALSALADRRIVLICGGYDKKIPYSPLAKSICTHGGVHTVVLTGATGEKIGKEIELYRAESGEKSEVRLEYRADFREAIDTARACAVSGDCVLLSPASASFDAFKNFAQRGDTFKRIVKSFT